MQTVLVHRENVLKRSGAGPFQPMLPSEKNMSRERPLLGARHDSHDDAAPIHIPFIVLYDNDRPASPLATVAFIPQVGVEDVTSSRLN